MRKIDFCANWRAPPEPKTALNNPFFSPDRGLGRTVGGVGKRLLKGFKWPFTAKTTPFYSLFGQNYAILFTFGSFSTAALSNTVQGILMNFEKVTKNGKKSILR